MSITINKLIGCSINIVTNSETDTYEPMKFPTKFAREDLDELINIGEALVGIAMTIKEEFEL